MNNLHKITPIAIIPEWAKAWMLWAQIQWGSKAFAYDRKLKILYITTSDGEIAARTERDHGDNALILNFWASDSLKFNFKNITII